MCGISGTHTHTHYLIQLSQCQHSHKRQVYRWRMHEHGERIKIQFPPAAQYFLTLNVCYFTETQYIHPNTANINSVFSFLSLCRGRTSCRRHRKLPARSLSPSDSCTHRWLPLSPLHPLLWFYSSLAVVCVMWLLTFPSSTYSTTHPLKVTHSSQPAPQSTGFPAQNSKHLAFLSLTDPAANNGSSKWGCWKADVLSFGII